MRHLAEVDEIHELVGGEGDQRKEGVEEIDHDLGFVSY